MSSLSDLWISRDMIFKIANQLDKKTDVKGVSLTVAINDESNKWGQNVSAFFSQTEDQRKAKEKKVYVGNGRCFWTDGNIKTYEKPPETNEQSSSDQQEDDSDLPF